MQFESYAGGFLTHYHRHPVNTGIQAMPNRSSAGPAPDAGQAPQAIDRTDVACYICAGGRNIDGVVMNTKEWS